MGNATMHPRQLPCWITHTNERTHEIIRGGLDRSPTVHRRHRGRRAALLPVDRGQGRRASPQRTSHQIFLEPEGLTTHEIYPNGISTSLPFDVQLALVRSIKGCERAHILRPGYAIEYDYFDPRALKPTLETKRDPGALLRRSDQRHDGIRGSGGPGPARRDQRGAGWRASEEGWYPRRDQAYLGVLVDDLVTRGVTEPYRMFTSRAEYRLQLREDNADLRLTEAGRELGVVDDARWDAFCRKRDAVARELERLKSTWVNPNVVARNTRSGCSGNRWNATARSPSCCGARASRYASLLTLPGAGEPVGDAAVAEQVEIATKYAGYIERQNERDRAAILHRRLCRCRAISTTARCAGCRSRSSKSSISTGRKRLVRRRAFQA